MVEFNKIEIIENDGAHLIQKTNIELVICKLLKQRLMNEQLKLQLSDYQFEGLKHEQKSLVLGILRYCKKQVSTLYKKCLQFSLVKQYSSQHISEIYFKDVKLEKSLYSDLVRKLQEVYEDFMDKAQFFKHAADQMFQSHP